jgi:hypothetical protein
MTAETGTEYRVLLDAYKTALREWTEARAAKPTNVEDVLKATRRVEEIEAKIRAFRGTQLIKYEPPEAKQS